MSKTIGYIVMLLGVVCLAAKFVFPKVVDTIPILSNKLVLPIIGVILIVAGFLMSNQGSSGKQVHEVPIYDKSGKNIVGYRRMK